MRWMIVAAALVLAACGQTATTTEEPAVAEPSASTAWDRDLVVLMPAIDRCIADARGPRQVSFAGEHDGMTLVRLQGADTSVDCRVGNFTSNAGAQALVIDVRPRDEALVVDGENAAIFVRGPGANPGGECYEAPEVRDASGAVIGWMLDPEGC